MIGLKGKVMATGSHPRGEHVASGWLARAGGVPIKQEATRYTARQPILDAHGQVYAYELLFRAGPEAEFRDAAQDGGRAATRSVLDQISMRGLESLAGGHTVFVNCTRESLLEGHAKVLPSGRTTLEILETLEPDDALLAACVKLRSEGYRIALDDFRWSDAWRPFVALADYIKVDIARVELIERLELMKHLYEAKCQARLVAERVETKEDFDQCRIEGFTLFQGFFFSKPVLLENRAIPSNRHVHLELLRALLTDPLNQHDLGELVKKDPSLTLRLLRLANSPIYGVRNEIRSIQMALQLVGDGMFRRMATLAIAGEMLGEKPPELLQMAFQRAHFCELAAGPCGQDTTEQYLIGMLSLVPALLHASMESVVEQLPLRDAVRYALLGANNAERATLSWLESYERANWDQCDALSVQLGCEASYFSGLYLEAIDWARENMPLDEISEEA